MVGFFLKLDNALSGMGEGRKEKDFLNITQIIIILKQDIQVDFKKTWYKPPGVSDRTACC